MLLGPISLSKFLARSLNSLLNFVPAHLRNMQDIIVFISSLHKGFYCHDVCNLYGLIPLQDKADGTLGIFSALRTIFSVHKSDCGKLQYLSGNKFESLLWLTSDVVLIGGVG